MDMKNDTPGVDEAYARTCRTPSTNRSRTLAWVVTSSSLARCHQNFITPLQGLQRLEKIMDEYVGGYSMFYATSEPLLNRSLELIDDLKRHAHQLGADSLHQLQRAWELNHRILTAEAMTHHTLYRRGDELGGYYYRADHPKLDDDEWHVFTKSKYDANTGEWQMSKLPVHHVVQ